MEPDTEKVVRGSRDGFVENIIINTALTRRRIRDGRLRFEIMRVGERGKTDIAIGYIEGVANQDLVEIIRKELQNIKIDGLTMADKTIEEFLLKQGYNPYPLVRYTERADVAATHILEGHVFIYVDTSPSVIITPTTIFHHMQHVEEYRQSAGVGTFIRGLGLSVFYHHSFFYPFGYYLFLSHRYCQKKLPLLDQMNLPIFQSSFKFFLLILGLNSCEWPQYIHQLLYQMRWD